MKELKKKINCRLCNSSKLILSINLGKSPLANQFSNKLNKGKTYPLKVLRCINCNHLQLSHVVSERKLFSKYLFVSGTSKTNLTHFKNYAREIKNRFLVGKSKILDIASNDGSFLNFFDKNNLRVGIDPAKNILSELKSPDFLCENKFFNYNESKKLKKKYGKFDIITANNVCAHIDDLSNFVEGIKNLLNDKGVFIFEVGYFFDVYKNKTFDTIYHEHLDYHLFLPLINFFKKFNLEIFDVKNIFIQGGSIRVYVSHKGIKKIYNKNITKIINKEKEINFSNNKIYKTFQKFINKKKKELLKKIKDLKSRNVRIAGYGASAKSTTFLNFFKLNYKYLDFIADLNALKHNKYSPGTKIKIVPPSYIYSNNIKYVIILSWNFSKEIILQNKFFLKKGGKFIIPFPQLLIIDKKNYKTYLRQ